MPPRASRSFVRSDAPGRRGVECLACVLLPYVRQLKVIFPPPPHKDLRAWKQAGATAAEVQAIHSIDDIVIGAGKPGSITLKLKKLFSDAARGKSKKYASWVDYI